MGVWRRQVWQAVKRLPHYLWVTALLLLLLGVLHQVSRPSAVQGVVNIDTVVVGLPGASPAAERWVQLPHVLDDEEAAWRRHVIYRVDWPDEWTHTQRPERLALLLPRVDARFRVLLNGHEIFAVGWYAPTDTTVLSGLFPHHIPIPGALLADTPSDNHILIEVAGVPMERSGLSPFQLGDYDTLFDRHRVLEVWQVMGSWMMAIASLFMGLISMFLWVTLKERLFVLMAAASFAHVVRLSMLLMLESPFSADVHFFVYRLAFNAYVAFFCLFIEELFGLRIRSVRLVAYFMLLSGPVWLTVAWWTQDYDFVRLWAGGLAAGAALSLLLFFVKVRWGRHVNQDQILVSVVALFTLITGVRDFLVLQLNFDGDADLRWMSVGTLALLFTLGWVLVQRATSSTREVHRLNATLSEIVATREAELRQAFDQLRQSEQQRAIEGERRRLMRDMHDGLGSQLVQTLNLVRSTQVPLNIDHVESMIRHALEELRITLDSLEPMEGDLPTILGTFRQRVGPALHAAGVELVWDVEEVPPLRTLDAQGVMHLFRCIQEVFANIVKHAQATRVVVRTFNTSADVILFVEDNGIGLSSPDPARHPGRGLDNLRVRAAKIGATVTFFRMNPGTGVEFRFPIAMQPAVLKG